MLRIARLLLLAGVLPVPGIALPSPPQPASGPASLARSHTIVGELTRVDFDSRAVTVKVLSPELRDYVLSVEPETRIVGGGREWKLVDLRPGDPVVVLCRDEGPVHHPTLIKTGSSRYAAPTPARRP